MFWSRTLLETRKRVCGERLGDTVLKSDIHQFRFAVPDAGEVSALLVWPPQAHGLLVLGHGAGAGMRHTFLETLSQELATAGLGTLRYQFPYVEQRRRVSAGGMGEVYQA